MREFKRKMLPVALFSIAFILVGSLPALAIPIVSIQPPVSTPAVGSFFDLFVDISGVTDLYAYQVKIKFDPSILSAISITEGSFLQSGGPTYFLPGPIDNSSGTIAYVASVLLGQIPGVSGSGILTEIKFQALSTGTSPIQLFGVQLADSTGHAIPSSFSTVDGAVSPIGVAEPATMILLGAGLIGLLGLRKKFDK